MGEDTVWVFRGLNAITIIQAYASDSVYIAWNCSIKAQVFLYTKEEKANIEALLNSGATKNLIHPS